MTVDEEVVVVSLEASIAYRGFGLWTPARAQLTMGCVEVVCSSGGGAAAARSGGGCWVGGDVSKRGDEVGADDGVVGDVEVPVGAVCGDEVGAADVVAVHGVEVVVEGERAGVVGDGPGEGATGEAEMWSR